MATDPTTAYINYLLAEKCFLECKCDEMSQLIQTTQSNVDYLNTFIHSTFDLSSGTPNCVHVVTYDACGNTLSCLNSDGLGGFTSCDSDMNGEFLPCVLPPMSRDLDKKKPPKKRGLCDYYNPYYPYYPYYKSYYDPYYRPYPYTYTYY
jgi:hypothetical protein